jgi:hypothetical protein
MNLTISLDAAFANTLSGSSDLVESLQVPDEVSVRLQELNVSSVPAIDFLQYQRRPY